MDDPDLFGVHRQFITDSASSNSSQILNNKRANLLLSLYHTAGRNGEWLASELAEDLLTEYCSIVDDRRGINNFASSTLELASKLNKDCKGWKSSLPQNGPNVNELLTNMNSQCSNPSENGCTAVLPTVQELDDFKKFVSNSSFGSGTSSKTQNVGQSTNSTKCSTLLENEVHSFSLVQPHFSQSVQPDNTKQSFFIPKKPQNNPILYTSEKEVSGLNVGVPHSKLSNPYESKAIKASNAAPFGTGGIYSNRVGGNFKKWGGKSKNEDSNEGDSIVQMGNPSSGFRGYKTNRNQEEHLNTPGFCSFKTATDQLREDNQKKYGNSGGSNFNQDSGSYQPGRIIKKSLGGKGSVNSKFVPPFRNSNFPSYNNVREPDLPSSSEVENEEVDERLKNVEPRMIELIKNEIMDCGSKITWDDIAGLHFAKTTIQEIVVWPMLRPDIFTGLRRPPKGILLFGPPGTGKTLIGKCIASQSGSTFFSISASSLTSKWIGEGEKMVRALFAVARVHQPSVVFIDEIDSLLSQRSESEHESSRRIKTEFLVQLDGAGTDEEDRLLVIGATNRPQELDEAARRRLVKRLYIPLPDQEARKEMILQLMKSERNELTEMEIDELAKFTEGYSGADMKHLCQEACLGPIRSLGPSQISSISANQVRPVNMIDFTSALKRVHPSVGPDDLHQYVTWNKTYGSGI